MGETFPPMPQPDELISDPPLCVDLDNTLLRTDHLYEALLLLVKRAPVSLVLGPFWLLKERAFFKEEVDRRVASDVIRLPFRTELVEYLRAEAGRGRKLILVTAAHVSIAQKVQKHLQFFSETIASNGSVNLKGEAKARALEQKFGRCQFDYAGDSRVDFAV